MRKPFIHEPDEAIDCGELGEHYPTILAWIINETTGDGATRHGVEVISVTICPLGVGQTEIRGLLSKALIRSYEEDILAAYFNAQEKEWEIA